MNCPNCREAKLVRINLVLSGEPVRMFSCSRCDTRWWVRDGETLDLSNVLELARVRR